MAEQTIICPDCGKQIPITKALTAQIEAHLRSDFELAAKKREKEAQTEYERKLVAEGARLEILAEKKAAKAASAELSKLQNQLSLAQRQGKTLQVTFERKLAQERSRIEEEARANAEKVISEKLTDLRKQLQEKNKQIADVEKQKIEVQKRQS